MAPPPPLKRLRKSISRWGDRRVASLERWLGRRSPVGGGELIAAEALPWVRTLEDNWATIRGELESVLTVREGLPALQDLSPLQYTITKDKVWTVFVFHAYGMRSARNCATCPETARLLDAIPDLEVAFFSVLEPGAHLAAHRGAYKGLIRTHLGLVVPEPRENVRMRVGEETIVWEEGKAVVFDDTYRHEVWNDTDGVRVVLLIDTPRPFPPMLDRVNRTLLRLGRKTAFVQDAIKNFKAWEDAFYAGRREAAE
jgi:beta-hydroxylase